MELRFASPQDRQKFDCESCLKARPQVSVGRKCMEPGYNNMPGMSVGKHGIKYKFCPGKATWDREITELFEQCLVARQTGILPGRGAFEDQHWLFCDVFPYFIEVWDKLRYREVWSDVREYVQDTLKQIFGK